MGKPAARATLDTGAHSAPILKGSLNVFIGGLPAARQGDPITCPSPDHSPAAIITGGSKTVFINGIPAARMTDETACGAPPPPPVAGPPSTPLSVFTLYSSSSEFYADKDKVGAKGEVAVGSYGPFKYASASGEGHIDKDKAGLKGKVAKGSYDSGEKEYNIGGVQGKAQKKGDIASVEAEGNTYYGNGKFGSETQASAALLQGEASTEATFGSSKASVSGKASGPNANAVAKGLVYTGGGDEKKIGFDFELGAGAAVASVEGEGGIEAPSGEYAKGSVGYSHGSVGVGGNLGAYYDQDKGLMVIKGGGDIAFVEGLSAKGEVGVSPWALLLPLVCPPLGVGALITYVGIKFIKGIFTPLPTPVPGTILTGCPTVLIGD